jgi:hypothetical protein
MPADDDRKQVLTSLPRSRPQRRSTKRAGAAQQPPAGDGPAASPPAPKPRAKPRAARPKPATEPRAAKAAKTAAQAPGAPKRTARPRPAATTAKRTPEPEARPVEPPTSADIVQSAVRAANELAQVGVTIGREAIKGVLSRLPRP